MKTILEELLFIKSIRPYSNCPFFSDEPITMIRLVLNRIIQKYPVLNEVYLYFINDNELCYTVSFGGSESNKAKISGFTFEDVKNSKSLIQDNGLQYTYFSPENEENDFIEICLKF